MRKSVCGLTLVLSVIGCNSDKRIASRLLKQYYECVTIAGPVATDVGEGNPRLEACLMSKGWPQDTANAISRSVYYNEVLVAGFTETAKHGRAAGDSVMEAVSAEQLRRAKIESMQSGLRDLIMMEEQYFSEHVRYTSIVGCPPPSSGAHYCMAEKNVLGAIVLTADGWTATMTRSDLPGVTCAIFIGSTPLSPAMREGVATCQGEESDSL